MFALVGVGSGRPVSGHGAGPADGLTAPGGRIDGYGRARNRVTMDGISRVVICCSNYL